MIGATIRTESPGFTLSFSARALPIASAPATPVSAPLPRLTGNLLVNPGFEQTLAGAFPDARGRFGPFGGRYVPETLVPALRQLEGEVTLDAQEALRLHVLADVPADDDAAE